MPRQVGYRFEKNVFINCPFDEEYYALLRPLLFTVLSFGFNPRIAFERSDSGEQRINKICQLIIKNHKDDPLVLIRELRNWFTETIGLRQVASPTVIWYNFNDFMNDCYDKRKSEGFSDEDVTMMPVPEFISFIKDWQDALDDQLRPPAY